MLMYGNVTTQGINKNKPQESHNGSNNHFIVLGCWKRSVFLLKWMIWLRRTVWNGHQFCAWMSANLIPWSSQFRFRINPVLLEILLMQLVVQPFSVQGKHTGLILEEYRTPSLLPVATSFPLLKRYSFPSFIFKERKLANGNLSAG